MTAHHLRLILHIECVFVVIMNKKEYYKLICLMISEFGLQSYFMCLVAFAIILTEKYLWHLGLHLMLNYRFRNLVGGEFVIVVLISL